MTGNKLYPWFSAFVAVALLLAACAPTVPVSSNTLRTWSGSENKTFESTIIKQCADSNNVPLTMVYKGSGDIANALGAGAAEVDAVWPANSLWIALGDSQKLVKDAESIYRTPVVVGVKKSVAQQLGWVGAEVSTEDLLAAMESGKLRLAMTNPGQSNSGASAYLAFLYAFAGQPEVLSEQDLAKPELKDKIRRLLNSVHRTSESSGFLEELYLANSDAFDAMVNYESLIIDANQKLVAGGREPLYTVYLKDGLSIADSPLGYVDHGDATKREWFDKMQKCLLSDETQKALVAIGRRAGLLGTNVVGDTSVFNPEWGIDATKTLSSIKLPGPDVIRLALEQYQTAFRKPSFTVYPIDFSGSMEGNGQTQLKAAMGGLLQQDQAKLSFLQAMSEDRTVVIPFNDHVIDTWSLDGNDAAQFSTLNQQVLNAHAGGGTDIYLPVLEAFRLMKERGVEGYNPAIILMTDGRSNVDRYAEVQQAYAELGFWVPIYAITFGDADASQLTALAELTDGHVYDGTKDLIEAFRKAKGNN